MLPAAWATCAVFRPPFESDVHVWWIEVSRWEQRIPSLRRLLASDERTRVERFRFARDAHQYTIGRALLRIVVGGAVRIPPEDLIFDYSSNGKPSVPGVHFNVSHSGNIVAIAMHNSPIGIDVEQTDHTIDFRELCHACFTTRERALILSEPASRDAFFRLWTRKEAWLKAVGAGLSFPLQDVDVSDAAAPVVTHDAFGEGSRPSRIVDLPATPGYMAACALVHPDAQIRLWNAEDDCEI